MLKNVRVAQGWGPEELQVAFNKKEERVKSRSSSRVKRRSPPKSLEELAIIVEVLEEDLKTPHTIGSSHTRITVLEPPAFPVHSPALTGYNSDGSGDMIPGPEPNISHSPWTEYQPLSPDHMSICGDFTEEQHSPSSWSLDSSALFWTQLQKEDIALNDISDTELLDTDAQGRNLLHNVVCVGKRPLAYAVAKRMAAINSLDLKDSNGMTALHYAAMNNHHLMVCDLIHLGASINERNNTGKSCLHLSAEKGYTQVLEVLKLLMIDGYFVDVEATDNSGMSVLQCAAVALKATVCEEESCSRLNSLCKEQMLETLEILLQMGSYLHSMGCCGIPHSS
uniref:Uncharacterized protein n=1 Tax=Knipowitschia caucasica TaxID=637954 RepID=A0AAV2J4B5_KNICA